MKENIVNDIKNAGKNSLHQWPDRMVGKASLAIEPQLAIGDWIPSPRKLRNASAKIADGTVKVIWTIIRPIVLGKRFFLMILPVFVPNVLEARTNS